MSALLSRFGGRFFFLTHPPPLTKFDVSGRWLRQAHTLSERPDRTVPGTTQRSTPSPRRRANHHLDGTHNASYQRHSDASRDRAGTPYLHFRSLIRQRHGRCSSICMALASGRSSRSLFKVPRHSSHAGRGQSGASSGFYRRVATTDSGWGSKRTANKVWASSMNRSIKRQGSDQAY